MKRYVTSDMNKRILFVNGADEVFLLCVNVDS